MPRLAQICFSLAALFSLLAVLAHEFIGAPMVLEPLSATDLPADVIWLHHASWHFGTVAVLVMIAMYGIAIMREDQRLMAVLATAMAVGFSIVGLGTTLFGDSILWGTPAPYAWVVVAIFGILGLVTTRRTR